MSDKHPYFQLAIRKSDEQYKTNPLIFFVRFSDALDRYRRSMFVHTSCSWKPSSKSEYIVNFDARFLDGINGSLIDFAIWREIGRIHLGYSGIRITTDISSVEREMELDNYAMDKTCVELGLEYLRQEARYVQLMEPHRFPSQLYTGGLALGLFDNALRKMTPQEEQWVTVKNSISIERRVDNVLNRQHKPTRF